MQYQLTVPLTRPPLTTNQAWQSHWRKRSAAKKQIEQTVGLLVGEAGINGPLGPCEILITWFAPDRRVRDNDSLCEFYKAAVDGLVKAGVLTDDNSDYVTLTSLAVNKSDTRNPRIEIRITEVDSA